MALDPVLIRTDEDKITEKKAITTSSVDVAQQIYNLLLPFEIQCTLTDIRTLLMQPSTPFFEEYVKNFVVDKVIARAGTPTFGGVPIKAGVVRDMLDLPDTTALKNSIFEISKSTNNKFSLDYLQLTEGVVSMTAGAFADIESKHTYYTQNDAGAELATKLLDYIDSFTDLNTWVGPVSDNTTGDENYYVMRHCNIPGLNYSDKSKSLVLNLGFIRKVEALKSTYVHV